METIQGRIKIIIDDCFGGNGSAAAREFNIPQGTLKNITGKTDSVPSGEVIQKILGCKNVNISSDWLILGIGDMTRSVEKGSEEIRKDTTKTTFRVEAMKPWNDDEVRTYEHISDNPMINYRTKWELLLEENILLQKKINEMLERELEQKRKDEANVE